MHPDIYIESISFDRTRTALRYFLAKIVWLQNAKFKDLSSVSF